MLVDCKQLFKICSVLLACSVLIVGCGSSSDSDSTDVSVDNNGLPDLSKSRWVSITTTQFSVTHSSYGAIDMELAAIEEGLNSPQSEQFSITLQGPELPLLDEGMYQLYNDTFGYIELYLQPATSSPGEQLYRAVFSILQI